MEERLDKLKSIRIGLFISREALDIHQEFYHNAWARVHGKLCGILGKSQNKYKDYKHQHNAE